MTLHFKDVCQYGFVHKQCRCPDPSKTEHAIECDNPSSHAAIKDEKPEKDHINPDHYKSSKSGVECIEVTRWMNFDLGNAVKYMWRLGQKDDSVQELKKVAWYINDQLLSDVAHGSRRSIPHFEDWRTKFKAHIDTMPAGHVSMAMKFILNYYNIESKYKPIDTLKLAFFEVAGAIQKAEVAGFEPAEVLPSTA